MHNKLLACFALFTFGWGPQGKHPGILHAGGAPLQTEDLRYGLRVSVLGIPAHPLLRTPEALAVVGPGAPFSL